jgi:hypothetical protein
MDRDVNALDVKALRESKPATADAIALCWLPMGAPNSTSC